MKRLKQIEKQIEDAIATAIAEHEAGDHFMMNVINSLRVAQRTVRQRIDQIEAYDAEQKANAAQAKAAQEAAQEAVKKPAPETAAT